MENFSRLLTTANNTNRTTDTSRAEKLISSYIVCSNWIICCSCCCRTAVVLAALAIIINHLNTGEEVNWEEPMRLWHNTTVWFRLVCWILKTSMSNLTKPSTINNIIFLSERLNMPLIDILVVSPALQTADCRLQAGAGEKYHFGHTGREIRGISSDWADGSTVSGWLELLQEQRATNWELTTTDCWLLTADC